MNTKNLIRRIVDAAMTVIPLCLMAYQVTGEAAHEWLGVAMTALVILHQLLNRRWYGGLFKGKYPPYRILTTALNVLLLLSFAMTAFSGMAMSGHAVPFLYGMAPPSVARQMHLSMSHWSFVLMGLHLGVHIPAMTAGIHPGETLRPVLLGLMNCLAGVGLYLFLKAGMPDYLFFRVPFAFLDYDKAGWLVFLENLLMLMFWAFLGAQLTHILKNAGDKNREESRFFPVIGIVSALVIGLLLFAAFPAGEDLSFGKDDWKFPQETVMERKVDVP